MIRLSVNVNKVATLRNARGGERPSVLWAARTAIAAGCHGITVHPRPDQRHVRRADVLELDAELPAEIEYNIEGYPSAEWLELVEAVRPAQATLVPDPPSVLTSNAGWRFAEVDRPWLAAAIARLRGAGCRVSLILHPDPREVEGARMPGGLLGGAMGLNIAGWLFGLPLEPGVFSRIIVIVSMLIGVLVAGIVIVTASSTVGWLASKLLESESHAKKGAEQEVKSGR